MKIPVVHVLFMLSQQSLPAPYGGIGQPNTFTPQMQQRSCDHTWWQLSDVCHFFNTEREKEWSGGGGGREKKEKRGRI